MLKPKKKLSHKEMKQDALLTSYAKATTFFETHSRIIGMVTVGVVAIGIVVLLFIRDRAGKNEDAMLRFYDIQALFAAGQYQQAIDGIPERKIFGLKQTVEETGGSRGGELARLLLATSYFQLRKYPEALEQFEEFSAPDDFLAVTRLEGIGQCNEAMGKYEEAASAFEKAAGVDAKSPAVAENLSNAARNYGLSGDKKRALELCQRLKKNHSTSIYARDVDRSIAQYSL